ncbi:phospholipase B1, membrane-associated-like isoform X1 [Phyllopteryx taeniolatus]|uniref:phospholipase B1, membrane-associated-like isoform X1 n=2 Tax=Phyllopteryx taeniolatus TaxID=161469 RepID=UPI002AD41BE8|nr:phospholipase B1, membrane-associated-like isoform X1 [Phyllopteryx taeniolatus]
MILLVLLATFLKFSGTTVNGLPCDQMLHSHQPPLNVNSVKPADVAGFASIGLHMHSTKLSNVVSRLQELMSMFNPALMDAYLEETVINAPQFATGGTLLEQAEEASRYLQNNPHSWKLLLLFVQVDQFYACDQQEVEAVITSAISEVDAGLQLLRDQLKRTLVSVALWDGENDTFQNKLCPCLEQHQDGEVRLVKATLTHALQASLDELLVKRHWYSGKDDFSVILQNKPLVTHLSPTNIGKPLSESQASHEADKLMLHLWTNLLQPASDKHNTDDNGNIIAMQCPTVDRPFLRTEGNSPTSHGGNASPVIRPNTGTPLHCEDIGPSHSTPTSVHELRPGDIRVVAAVGDSLTAGNGVASSPANVLDVLTQYRGLSWSVGGDDNLTTVTTLPNILKHFNANVTGYSVGKGKQYTPQAFLNQAVAGAKSKDLLSQVRALVARMKNDSSINFGSDWKVITVFIGGNDLCDYCYNSLFYSVKSYIQNIQESLDYLHKEVPRALLNLVEPLHIIPLREMHVDASLKCPTWLVNILCPCVTLPKSNSTALEKLDQLNRKYQLMLSELVESGRYDTRPDFTVVTQPFFRDIIVPRLPDGRPDRSYFSADCFHLSQKAQTQMARSLWNNMLETLGNKTSLQDFSGDIQLKCPSKTSPFIRTYRNSNYTYAAPPPTPAPNTNWGSDFSCVDLAPSQSVPTSVHKLRPADIKVVGAVGDSTTAGTGAKAKNLLQLSREYKGVSWSIGGDRTLDTVTTLPNILRKFNSALKGFSKGQGSRQKGFNMAAAGAKTSDIPNQIQALIKAMREHKEVNFDKDWKLLTIFVGGNDLCHYCNDQNNLSPSNYSRNLMLALDKLYHEVPRLLVNLVEIMQIDTLKQVKKNTLGCSLLQRTSCPCVINPTENSPEIEEVKRINLEYQAEIHNLISGSRYDGKEDFAVVLQPFLHNSFIPFIGEGEADTTLFSVDCFHISERAHAEMSIALWNNMLEPVGRKQAYNNFTYDRSKIHCPTESSPFLFTKVNSASRQPWTTTAASHTTSTTQTVVIHQCATPRPLWVPVVVGVVSLLVGIAFAWFMCSFVLQKRSKTQCPVEMKATGL